MSFFHPHSWKYWLSFTILRYCCVYRLRSSPLSRLLSFRLVLPYRWAVPLLYLTSRSAFYLSSAVLLQNTKLQVSLYLPWWSTVFFLFLWPAIIHEFWKTIQLLLHLYVLYVPLNRQWELCHHCSVCLLRPSASLLWLPPSCLLMWHSRSLLLFTSFLFIYG